jgi:hypothetical protein
MEVLEFFFSAGRHDFADLIHNQITFLYILQAITSYMKRNIELL